MEGIIHMEPLPRLPLPLTSHCPGARGRISRYASPQSAQLLAPLEAPHPIRASRARRYQSRGGLDTAGVGLLVLFGSLGRRARFLVANPVLALCCGNRLGAQVRLVVELFKTIFLLDPNCVGPCRHSPWMDP